MNKRLKKVFTTAAKYSYVFILFLIVIFMSFASDQFLTGANLLNVLRQASLLLIMALGMTMAMLLGRGVDMSLGAIVSISSCFAAQFFLRSSSMVEIILGIVIGIAVGAFCGALNGIMITFLHLPAMLATYGLREILRGVAYAYMDGNVITNIHPFISFLGNGRIAGVFPTPVVMAVLFTLICTYFLKRTKTGRELYLTGANPQAAKFSGINVDRTIILGFVLSGVMAAVAGILYVGRLGAAEAEIGNDFHFQAVSAAAIGGVSFNGGSGKTYGVVAGALILTLLNNAQNLLSISSSWQGVIYGTVIIIAVLIDYFVTKQQTN